MFSSDGTMGFPPREKAMTKPIEVSDSCGCKVSVYLTPSKTGEVGSDFNVKVARCRLHHNAKALLAAAKEVIAQSDLVSYENDTSKLEQAVKDCEEP